ncbi:Glycosyl transferase, group 1 family protein [Candidatus Burkholderia verschuerenii]|uniref:Glycosyl transferase, group 1 family protein n=1 Tax=Candidatus Burkholderia verschuerenii TaxID=242163 RepID=A0A0L0M497_9BURK|nr:glycosyltransferase [Candidatus Burkholderia verschuerenii]KND57106.1 Glycosyl transferase, group 1 family protein [Candidatus Burkholderia verschuerenii]
MASAHRADADIRCMLLKLEELVVPGAETSDAWLALLADAAGHRGILRNCVLRLVKEGKSDEAIVVIDRHVPETADDAASGLSRAELLADARAHEASDELFDRLIGLYDRRDIRIAFAKRLKKRGLLGRANAVLVPVASSVAPDSKAGQLVATLADDYAFYRRFEPEFGLADQDFRILAMKHAILQYRNRTSSIEDAERPRSVALVTGSLGPGGAERQLTRLACHLQRVCEMPQYSKGEAGRIDRVEVLVKQHTVQGDTRKGHRIDFFLGTMNDACVKVTEINTLPSIAANQQALDDADTLRLLQNLPPQVNYGVTRLAPLFRERRFDVVSLWQDGTCLFGALAALIASVPVIHLVFRGLPPNIRAERYRPEYAVLYKALAEVPGVVFVCNSRTGAQAYADWLDMPVTRFKVLYNGVPELSVDGADEDVQRWEAFDARCADATEMIGGVFRFEPDKRPLTWIRLAARYLKMRPLARFFIVGDGRLQQSAVELAAELGVADRMLFADLSSHVGYWYSKMDAKVLLSRFEGLPNVLIEAQMLGVGTVSTPAGGAGECFVDGVTGHLLESAEQPDLQAACERLAALVDRCRAEPATRDQARDRASTLFSVPAMTAMFNDLCFPETRLVASEHALAA